MDLVSVALRSCASVPADRAVEKLVDRLLRAGGSIDRQSLVSSLEEVCTVRKLELTPTNLEIQAKRLVHGISIDPFNDELPSALDRHLYGIADHSGSTPL